MFLSSSSTRVVCIKDIWFPAAYTGCNGLGSGLGSNVERGFDGMGILCVFCVYDTIGNRCFEKTSFPKITKMSDFHHDTIICYIDIITCNSDSLLNILESVISKLSFKIIWTSDCFSFFIIFKKDKSYKMHLLAKKWCI